MGIVAAVVGAAVLGAGATAYKVNEEKKAAKKQKRRIDKKEAQAKLEARNQASLSEKEETGAEIALGREEETAAEISKAGSGGGTSRKGSVKRRVGGLGTVAPRSKPSSRIGL